MLTKMNVAGTMADQFSIGKRGPTIYQGTAVPTGTLGIKGDLYICAGTLPVLYLRRDDGWLSTSNPSFGFTRAVAAADGYVIPDSATYVGVQIASTCTVTLPTGFPGKQIVIKDESGSAGTNTITVSASSSTIDGQSTWNIDINYGSLTLVYGNTGWFILSAITSSPYNQAKL